MDDVIAALRDPDVDTRKIGEALSQDPVLSAKVMRLANSAFFGGQRSMASIDAAVALIGIQAVILNDAKIGAGSIVGAGSVVTEGKAFPPRSLIIGSPAKVVRTLDEADAEKLRTLAAHYVENAARFRRGLKKIA